jgi:hypothetical protein
MDNDALKGSGPSFIGDLARMGGDIAASMTLDQLKGSGPSFPADLARMGGAIVGPKITGTPVTTATQNSAYTGFTASATGGKTPYTFALVGTWPAGISVNSSTGAVSGTPTASGTFSNLSVKATDANGSVAQLPTFTLTVATAG